MSKDPSFTLSIRNKAIKEITKRFSLIKNLIKKSLKENHFFRINNADRFQDSPFQYTTSEEYIEAFMQWLQETIDEAIFDDIADAERLWLNEYIKQSYEKGITLSQAALENASPALGVQTGQLATTISLTQSTAQRLLIPVHLERTKTIYSRAYGDLKGVTETMSRGIRDVLTEGIFAGQNPNKLAEKIIEKVDGIGINRAKLVARTEIIRANQLAVITDADATSDSFKALGVETKFKWRTGDDDRVRATHKARNNKIYDRETVLGLIGEPNCRCAVFPVYEDIK